MLKKFRCRTVFVLLLLGLLSACSSTSEKTAANADIEPYQSADTPDIYDEPLTSVEPDRVKFVKITPAVGHDDLWERIRAGFAISDHQTLHPTTRKRLEWFASHPEYMNRVAERARPYLHYIVEELDRRNMPMEIALLPVVESGYEPFAYSHGRAAGIWQFIPGTGKVFGLEQNWWYDGRRDIVRSTHAALDYLEKLYNDFGDWELAIAAYNAGEGTVGRAIKHNQAKGKKTDFWSLDLPAETTAYVPKLLAVSHLILQPETYNLALMPIDNQPVFEVIDVGSQIDLALAADMAGISTDELYQFNPGHNRWATAPDGPHQLVVPLESAEAFKQKLAKLPESERLAWDRHKIRPGESLGVIADRHNTTVAVLKQANQIENNTIRAGNHILVPAPKGRAEDYGQTADARQQSQQNAPRQGKKLTYQVKPGDSWWKLSREYNVNIQELTQWNDKAPDDTLQPGQQLVIWLPDAAEQRLQAESINYTIRDGDSLWKISRQFNVSVADVREWNDLSHRTLLRPGQQLTLYLNAS